MSKLCGSAIVVAVVLALPWSCAPGEGQSDAVVPDGGELKDSDSDEGDAIADVEAPKDAYPGEPGAMGVFLEEREGFYDQPFPCDLRRKANGAPDMDGFPNPAGIELLEKYIKQAELRLDGFSANGAIYFRFDGAIDTGTLPGVGETDDVSSPVLLVNVTEGSPAYGIPVPVETWFWDREEPKPGYYLAKNVLAVRPLGGFPLRQQETYACILTRAVKDMSGRHLAQTPQVADALTSGSASSLADVFEPLSKWLDTSPGIGAEDIAIATVFTVADIVTDMVAMEKQIQDDFDLKPDAPLKLMKQGGKYNLYEGSYMAPNFMSGDPPYDTGGDITFGADGKAKEQWEEEIWFGLTVPKSTMPPGGWAVVQYSHGTGGDRFSFVGDIAAQMAEKGIAVISIDQPLHGKRGEGIPESQVEFYSFNFMNPSSARNLFRQSAVDSVSLTKFVRGVSLKAGDETVEFDPGRVAFFGHSQGGLTGAMYVAVDSHAKSAVLSGAGGGLGYTILLRKQVDSGTAVDIKEALEMVLALEFDDEFTLFHPVLTLCQMLVDVTDPLNYSPHYFYPRFRSEPLHLLLTEGVDDPYTPAVTTENLAIAGHVPPMFPVVHGHPGFVLCGSGTAKLPVSQNLSLPDGSKATAMLAQYEDYGHFVAFQDPGLQAMWTNFLTTSLKTDSPVIKQ